MVSHISLQVSLSLTLPIYQLFYIFFTAMPNVASSATLAKHVRKESNRQREGRENEETLKCERAQEKTAAKTRKTAHDEAADDEDFVERDGDSPELTKLRSKYSGPYS
jgi:hypothetical protein